MTRSFTGRSPPARTSRICRRRGSATALNASAVVAARAMGKSYTHIGIRQAWRPGSAEVGGVDGVGRGAAAGVGDRPTPSLARAEAGLPRRHPVAPLHRVGAAGPLRPRGEPTGSGAERTIDRRLPCHSLAAPYVASAPLSPDEAQDRKS